MHLDREIYGGTYDGEFKAGKPHGEGRREWTNGNIYQGLWEGGLHHGAGEITYGNGDSVSGIFERGHLHGVGSCTSDSVVTPCTFFYGERLD